MRHFRLGTALLAASLGAACHAQLVFGSTTSATATSGAFYLNVDTGSATRLWSGTGNKKVNGMAADTSHGVIWSNDSARLNRWDYGTTGTAPTFVSGFYRKTATGGGSATGVDALAYANGKLYGYTDYPSSVLEDGIYLIDPTVVGSASKSNMELVWSHPDKQYNFEGLEFDPTTNLFYATNTVSGSAPTTDAGIYSIDLFSSTVTVNKIASFDSDFLANPDGLTIGGGKLWLSGKPAGSELLIESFDLTTHQYVDQFSLTITGDAAARSTDMTWAPGALAPVPEPASMVALTAGVVAVLRRRKK